MEKLIVIINSVSAQRTRVHTKRTSADWGSESDRSEVESKDSFEKHHLSRSRRSRSKRLVSDWIKQTRIESRLDFILGHLHRKGG